MMHAMDVARTHEILARYRPIAPKPPMLDNPPPPTEKAKGGSGGRVPAKIPRTRKRGRGNYAGSSFASSHKRSRTFVPVLPSTSAHSFFPPAYTVFGTSSAGLPATVDKLKEGEEGDGGGELLTLSLLPCSPMPASEVKEKDLDLNYDPVVSPVEKDLDLLGSRHKPCNVIVPQPVRPVGSSIRIGCISEGHGAESTLAAKKPQEVEEEVESELLPAVVSDSNNRVRLANSAYKEMIGQPKCLWLDTMVGCTGTMVVSNRIGGEVMLDLSEAPMPVSSSGFSCKAKIEWTCNGQKKHLTAPCNVARLSCESKGYAFTWRFHTKEASVSSC